MFFVVIPSCPVHLGVELDVAAQLVLVGNPVEVVLDLALVREEVCPARVLVKGVRVQVRWNVTSRPGVGVLAPSAANVVGLLQQDEIDTPLSERDGHADSGEASSDDQCAGRHGSCARSVAVDCICQGRAHSLFSTVEYVAAKGDTTLATEGSRDRSRSEQPRTTASFSDTVTPFPFPSKRCRGRRRPTILQTGQNGWCCYRVEDRLNPCGDWRKLCVGDRLRNVFVYPRRGAGDVAGYV